MTTNKLRHIEITYPRHVSFGPGRLEGITERLRELNLSRLFLLTDQAVASHIDATLQRLRETGIAVKTCLGPKGEPTFDDLEKTLLEAREFRADCVAGIGGGSVLDVAKLTASLLHYEKPALSVVGSDLPDGKVPFFCAPTTAGAGSEASPNAILIDESDGSKKGIISPGLVPDYVYLDPKLAVSLPPNVTAYTGVDALTHCIEAFTNRFAHPLIDGIALEGIRLISGSLLKAVAQGGDLEARSNMALGSFYGGMCLGPVNTAAVHALAYPLGTMFKIPHGLCNALLLPYIMEYNLEYAEERYAAVASAMGIQPGASHAETAAKGISRVKELIKECGLPARLSELDIPSEAIGAMAEGAVQVKRLLKNNVREVKLEDAANLYQAAF